jgi:hypothetical protein
MTQDEIIEMAREAGYRFADDTDQRMANHGQWQRNLLEAFAKLVADKEREACAKICDEFCYGNTKILVEKAIRLRGETE